MKPDLFNLPKSEPSELEQARGRLHRAQAQFAKFRNPDREECYVDTSCPYAIELASSQYELAKLEAREIEGRK